MTKRSPRRAPEPEVDVDQTMRVLPHNLEAEKAVLGACLINTSAYDRAAELLTPEHFFRRGHQAVFAAFGRLLNEQKTAVDLVTVKAELARVGELDEAGGAAYLGALVDGIPRSTNVGHYARIVKDAATRRAVIRAANVMLEHAYAGEAPADEIVTAADRAIIELQRGAAAGRLVDLRTTAPGLLEEIEYRVNHRGTLTGVPTGFASIDELTMGWQPGDMIVVAARPSIGKTAFILNTATHAASLGKRVALFSLEMRRKQLEYRLLSSLSQVPATAIMSGNLGEQDLVDLGGAMARMSELEIHVDDRGGQTVWEIRAACRRLKAEHGLDLVIVDYIQLMPGTLERRGATRNDEVTDISRRFKQLADEVSVPILVLSQLNRAGDARSDKRPILSDLRESGALEQDADLVCFLHRKHHRESGTTQFILEKQRNGPTGTVNLTIKREVQTFVDGGEDPPPDPKPEKPKPPPGAFGRRKH